MVMETPSPQCVGREFVRQYYTLLHEAPLHLHRFYSNNSSFVHGGVEKPGEEQPPVMGQNDIHEKIMSLNFRDCHAKIRQVDSQATVGNAVVVQVTGELSNNGLPMRRFMQTFVLAPQSAKKYYVHNDIFRYQDEVFHDSDTDTENPEDTVDSETEAMENTVGGQPTMIQDSQGPYFTHTDPHQPLSNGSTLLEEERMSSPVSHKSEDPEPEPVVEPDDEPLPTTVNMDQYEPDKEPPAPADDLDHLDVELQEEVAVEPKPYSWAAMASKNTPNSMPQIQPMPVVTQHPPQVPKGPAPGFGPRPEVKQDTSPNAPREQRVPRPPRGDRGRERDRISLSRDEGPMIEERRGSRFLDNQQLFVGNLPHNVSEKELKQFFSSYGNVVELRINTKGTSGKLPNFGFVVFDSTEAVQAVLSDRPIKFNGEHRLNVEEKKPRGSEGRPIGRGPPPRSGSAGGGGGFGIRGGNMGRGMGQRGGGPMGMRDAGGRGGGMRDGGMREGGMREGGMREGGRGGMAGPRR